jgi:ribonuclease HI
MAALIPTNPYPTEDKAKLVGILLALQDAQSEYYRLPRGPNQVKVIIYTESQYAKGCMEGPLGKWRRNCWKDDNGKPIVNAEVLRRADRAQRELCRSGSVEYILTPRANFMYADMMEMLRVWENGAVLPPMVI